MPATIQDLFKKTTQNTKNKNGNFIVVLSDKEVTPLILKLMFFLRCNYQVINESSRKMTQPANTANPKPMKPTPKQLNKKCHRNRFIIDFSCKPLFAFEGRILYLNNLIVLNRER